MTQTHSIRPLLSLWLGLCCSAPLARGETNVTPESPPAPTNQRVEASSGRAYTIYVDGMPGADIRENVQKAIDAVRAGGGGTVVLPPGNYTLSGTIYLAGSAERFLKGGPQGITLTGSGGANGTTLNYRGPENSVVIDLAGPWGCAVKELTLDGAGVEGVIGIRYHGGYDRWVNGGKNNTFEQITVEGADIGIEIGDLFGPDLVGSTYTAIRIADVRIGVRVLAANGTGMCFFNVILENYREAGFKLLGFSGRRIRRSTDDPPPSRGDAVLMDADGKREIFESEVPPFVLERMALRREDGQYVVGGGSNDTTIFGVTASSEHQDSWLIETNSGHIRVYGAKLDGCGGLFRSAWPYFSGRFNDVLMDVSMSGGNGRRKNAIEFFGRGPLYLIGGSYDGDISLRSARVYAMGVQFRDGGGFRQIGGTPVAAIHQLTPSRTFLAPVPKGNRSMAVRFDRPFQPSDGNSVAVATPQFDAGSVWITDKTAEGFQVNFEKDAPGGALLSVMVRGLPGD